MFLSREDIIKHLKNGNIGIEPFNEEHLTPNGYDFSIFEALVDNKLIKGKDMLIPAKSHALLSTAEYVKLGKGIAGQLWQRTSMGRKGIISSFGLVDAGFEGNLTLSIYNSSDKDIIIPYLKRFVQMAFVPLSSETEKGYSELSGNYQGQKGVTLSKDL